VALPFLKLKNSRQDGVITQVRPTDEGKEPAEDLSGLEAAMADLCHAEEAKDYKGMAKAFKAAFEMLESEPHNEYPHNEE
jgi:hypothetical protein